MSNDPFKMEKSGLDDVDVLVEDAWFAHDPEWSYDDDPLFLYFTLDVDSEDYDEPEELRLKCGTKFTTEDSGKSAVHESGVDKRTFHEMSAVAKFLASCLANGGEDDLRERAESDGVGPKDSALWKGAKFRLVQLTDSFENDEGSQQEYSYYECADWHGLGKKSTKGKKSGGKKKSAIPANVREEIDEIADASDNHDEFVEMVRDTLDPDDLTDAVEKAIASEDGKVWQAALDRAEEA